MTPRDRRPDNEQGPVNWGIMPKKAPRPKNAATRPGGSGCGAGGTGGTVAGGWDGSTRRAGLPMSLGVLDGAVDGAQGNRGRGRARRHGGVGPSGVVTCDVGQVDGDGGVNGVGGSRGDGLGSR